MPRKAADGSDSVEMPVLGQRSELVAQLVETIALLTQHTTIHGRIQLHGLAQRPHCTEKCRLVCLCRGSSGRASQNGSVLGCTRVTNAQHVCRPHIYTNKTTRN